MDSSNTNTEYATNYNIWNNQCLCVWMGNITTNLVYKQNCKLNYINMHYNSLFILLTTKWTNTYTYNIYFNIHYYI